MMDFTKGPYASLSSPAQTLGFPEVLDYQSAKLLIEGCEESTPLLGIDGEGNKVTVNLDSESPHVLVSASTGGGKSAVLRGLAAQMLNRGSIATILDLKQHSHWWAKDLSNVGYAKTLPEIGNALYEIGVECHRRNEIVSKFPGPPEDVPNSLIGPRLIVVFEEMNATMGQLRELSRRLPRGSYTAYDAFRDILFMGRSAHIHCLSVAQFADARAMGGPDIRENFTTRILIKYSKNAWTMLAWDCGLPIPAPEHIGRGMVCRGGKARQTQLLYLTEREAVELADTNNVINMSDEITNSTR